MFLYLLLKWLHILAAITAVGANFTYGIWLSRAAKQPEMLPFALRTVKFIDDRIANPAYGVVLVTGLALVFVLPWPLTTSWVIIALALYAAVTVMAIVWVTPGFHELIRLAESGRAQSPEYAAAARRSRMLGLLAGLIVLVILYLMVVKPQLW